jgi:hypothetical protein
MSKSDETRQLTDSEQQTFHELYQKYHERVYSIRHGVLPELLENVVVVKMLASTAAA